MLTLTRRREERPVFSPLGITVPISKLARVAARIASEAPLKMRILREELPSGPATPHRWADDGFTTVPGRATPAVHLAPTPVEPGRPAVAWRSTLSA